MKNNKINNLLFGVEFEFSDVSISDIKNSIDSTINFYKAYSHWNVISDCTCTINNLYTGVKIGGEIVSPILNFDNKENFNDIKFILNELIRNNACINDNTGFHLHFNAPQVINSYNYVDLFDLWLAFETVIYKFGFNKFQNGRKIIKEHAVPLNLYQKEFLSFISYCRNNNIPIEELNSHYSLNEIIYEKMFGLNLYNTFHKIYSAKNTIEIKCCDANFNYEEVYTIANFFKNLFEILINDYDKDYISYLSNKLLKYNSYKTFFDHYKTKDIELFYELLNIMNADSKLEEKYIRQYLK